MFAHWKLADTRAVGMVWVKITDIIGSMKADFIPKKHLFGLSFPLPIGSMYAIYIYGNMYHQYIITPNVSMYIYIYMYTIHGSYGLYIPVIFIIYPFIHEWCVRWVRQMEIWTIVEALGKNQGQASQMSNASGWIPRAPWYEWSVIPLLLHLEYQYYHVILRICITLYIACIYKSCNVG